ncbi:MAG: DISARM system helicase DrmA [Actinomycetota bacterium]|nr:DISARM system helicase DrmA [Actinomycetota bacterium]
MDDSIQARDPLPGVPVAPAEIRAEFERLIVADLLGPAGGEDEQLLARNGAVRDRYMLGSLAPAGTVGVDPERNDEPAVSGDVAPDLPEDISEVEAPAAKATMFPSSIGVSCVVDDSVSELVLDASWGTYLKEVSEPEELAGAELPASPGRAAAAGGPQRVWQRYPSKGTVTIALADGGFGPVPVAGEHPGVVVRGRVTRRGLCWLVSVFLVNEQESADRNSDEQWLFQVGFTLRAPTVDHPGGAPVFVGRQAAVAGGELGAGHDPDDEVALLDLQYRNHVEFGVGHSTAVHAVLAGEDTAEVVPTRAVRLETNMVPSFEVPRTEAPTVEEEPALAAAVLDMSVLATCAQGDLRAALEPLVDAYEAWLDRQAARLAAGADGLAGHEAAAQGALVSARHAADRIRAGIDVLEHDAEAAEAFRFANEAMWQQRIHTVATATWATDDEDFDLDSALVAADVAGNRSWRPFQLAFVLLNVPALADPTHPERSPDAGLVDLLFFPTGGGKTEAYLGLTAFTLAIRRLQGTVCGHDGEGVAVLMRYTLRLLTADQFQRAAALICACELLRREKVGGDPRWGDTPFRIGLWVGSSLTPNRGKEAQAAIEDTRAGKRVRSAQPVQLTACPWCGRRIDPGVDARYDADRWRTLVFCGDPLGACPFTAAASGGEGLPVLTVDEEIYRLLPGLLISTADKWAQLPLKGPLHLLFGRLSRRCERHGYRSADLDVVGDRSEADSHHKTKQLPAAQTVACNPLRPPDLIIQDELHLIAGPLGTLVGLYESAVDELASWEVDGKRVRPKVVASTATVRRAAEQVYALFWRRLEVFPPPVLDVEDSFFARQRPAPSTPGRRYVGICAPGQRMASLETRVFTAALAAGQVLYEKYQQQADPWMTLVGYFSSLRELGAAKRLVEDDVRSRLFSADQRGLKRRKGLVVRELTSRISSGEVAGRLDELSVAHDPTPAPGAPRAIDVLLATNMISVGVDVPRLGLMVAVGQPKATAEYIQATSRVGRTTSGPGLVLTLYNWARPRDLSHYETFEHYHATFYRHVEALSVTPFAARALDRGLSAVLVALLRQHGEQVADWNPNDGAAKVQATGHPLISEVVERLVSRAEGVSSKAVTGDLVRTMVISRLDDWVKRQKLAASGGAMLGYAASPTLAALLEGPTMGDWALWAVPNSLRETEPNVNLIIDEKDWTLGNAPPWKLGTGTPAPAAVVTAEDGELPEELAGEVADEVAP